jgi:transposase
MERTGYAHDRKSPASGEGGCISIVEVVMRSPEVFVRSLAHEEALRLKRMAKRSEHSSTRQRAAILLGSNARLSAAQIAASWLTDESHVRKVIHDFNERGFGSLDPDYWGGRRRRITADQRQQIVAVAGARPDTQGVALTRWSLPRLSIYLANEGQRVLELTGAAPADGGAVVSFDQMGPLSRRPIAGAGWAPAGRPERASARPATADTRYAGISS